MIKILYSTDGKWRKVSRGPPLQFVSSCLYRPSPALALR